MPRFSWIILLLVISDGAWSANPEQLLLAAVSQGREQSVQDLLVQGFSLKALSQSVGRIRENYIIFKFLHNPVGETGNDSVY